MRYYRGGRAYYQKEIYVEKHCVSKQYDTLTIIACKQALARGV